MSLNISASSKDFEIHPAGVYAARCTRLIDLGTQDSEYMGQKKRAKKVMVAFETTQLMTEGDFAGQPFLVSNRYTASLHENAALRKALKSWRGRDFTAVELDRFDMKTILGKPCMLNVVHNIEGEKTYANIDSIMPLPAGMPPPKAAVTIHFDVDEPDMEVFGKLSKGMQETISRSPEFQLYQKGASYAQDESASGSGPSIPDDSDIPF